MKTINKEDYMEDFEFVSKFYCEDINNDVLKTQLGILANTVPEVEAKYS